MQWGKVLFTFCTRVLYRSSHDHHRAFVCLPFIHFISLLNYLFYTSLCEVSSSSFLVRFLIHVQFNLAVFATRMAQLRTQMSACCHFSYHFTVAKKLITEKGLGQRDDFLFR